MRIWKAPDPEGIAFYQDVIAAAKANGLAPHVSLFHFSTPEWFWEERDGKRGWERPDALEHWNRYVSAVSQFLGPEINHWCTLNEPMVYVLWGYIEGVFPPLEQRAGPIDVAPVVAQLLRAHADAYQNSSRGCRCARASYRCRVDTAYSRFRTLAQLASPRPPVCRFCPAGLYLGRV